MQCGAKCRDGHSCKGKPMANGRCRMHGGAATGRPIIHGRYSKSLPADLKDRYEYFKADPDILSLKPEIALARTMMERFMSCFVEGQKIGVGVGEELRSWFDSISKITERCDKILNGERYTVNLQGLNAVIAQISDIISSAIDECVKDGPTADSLRDAISRGLAGIHGAGDSLPPP